jgi:hypothetical protein
MQQLPLIPPSDSEGSRHDVPSQSARADSIDSVTTRFTTDEFLDPPETISKPARIFFSFLPADVADSPASAPTLR